MSKVCICGCGGTTKGGDFLPGHDAKYKSFLIKEAMDGNNEEAIEILEQRGWTHFLDKKREMAGRPKLPKKPRPRPATLRAVETLRLMKAASKVLKWTDQYRKGTVYTIKLTAENAASIALKEHPELRIPDNGTDHEPFTDGEQAAIDEVLARSATQMID